MRFQVDHVDSLCKHGLGFMGVEGHESTEWKVRCQVLLPKLRRFPVRAARHFSRRAFPPFANPTHDWPVHCTTTFLHYYALWVLSELGISVCAAHASLSFSIFYPPI